MESLSERTPAFVSYAREDSEFALRLAADLKASGANVWLDQLDIRPGRQWDREVEHALSACSELLVILSPAAIDSNNVMDEVAFALEERKTVIPVLHLDCRIPFRLRRVQYIDFRLAYEPSVEAVLGVLVANNQVASAPKRIIRPTSALPESNETSDLDALEPEKGEAAQKAEQDRLDREKAEAARKAEQDRLDREKADAAQKAEQDRLDREKADAARKAEQDRLDREKAEAARKAEPDQPERVSDLSLGHAFEKAEAARKVEPVRPHRDTADAATKSELPPQLPEYSSPKFPAPRNADTIEHVRPPNQSGLVFAAILAVIMIIFLIISLKN